MKLSTMCTWLSLWTNFDFDYWLEQEADFIILNFEQHCTDQGECSHKR